jgi:hypothetical protein
LPRPSLLRSRLLVIVNADARDYHTNDGRTCEKMVASMVIMNTTLALTLTCAALTGHAAPGGALSYTAPSAWRARPAASSMRVAEFVVPRAQGDAEDAELVIYYFGAFAVGTSDANIDRWIAQVQQPDGSPSAAKARRATRTINGLKVSTVDVAGTYTAEMRPGAAEHYNKPNFRLCAAVVDTPRGAYYVKLTGPANTVGAAQADYAKLLDSLRYAP